MKKHLLVFLSLAFIALTFAACSDDSSSPSTNNSSNITESEFPTTATGGDPRGTYTPNTPMISMKLPTMPIGSMTISYTKNTGSGTITFEGSSATSGTYKSTDFKMEVEGKMNISFPGIPDQEIPFPGEGTPDVGFDAPKSNGTWRVVNGQLFLDDETEGSGYTVNSKGLFFVNSYTEEGMTGSVSVALRKK